MYTSHLAVSTPLALTKLSCHAAYSKGSTLQKSILPCLLFSGLLYPIALFLEFQWEKNKDYSYNKEKQTAITRIIFKLYALVTSLKI